MSISGDLRELKELHDSGGLSDEEFSKAKAMLLGSSSSGVEDSDINHGDKPPIQLDITAGKTKPLAEVNSNTSEYYTLDTDGLTYGPYSLDEMRQFWGEGILDAQSRVSVDGCAWHDADFASFC